MKLNAKKNVKTVHLSLQLFGLCSGISLWVQKSSPARGPFIYWFLSFNFCDIYIYNLSLRHTQSVWMSVTKMWNQNKMTKPKNENIEIIVIFFQKWRNVRSSEVSDVPHILSSIEPLVTKIIIHYHFYNLFASTRKQKKWNKRLKSIDKSFK